jgi:hypothetical protein
VRYDWSTFIAAADLTNITGVCRTSGTCIAALNSFTSQVF